MSFVLIYLLLSLPFEAISHVNDNFRMFLTLTSDKKYEKERKERNTTRIQIFSKQLFETHNFGVKPTHET